MRGGASHVMQKKDLKKLKRSELLEIMLAQSDEIDRLQKELAEKDRQLEDRQIKIAQSGSIAEASLKLTRVFEEAQKAADLYLANVKANAAMGAAPNTGAHTARGAHSADSGVK